MSMGNNSSTYESYYKSIDHGGSTGGARGAGGVGGGRSTGASPELDPYEVLGVGRTFQWDELKSNYRRIARLVHPDKGGSEELFNAVTECFRTLAQEYKAREEKSHDQLRQGSRDYYKEREHERGSDRERDRERDRELAAPLANDDDRSKFNRMFEENRFDEEDGTGATVGYGTKMVASTGKVREDFDIPRMLKKYDNKSFNKVFETVTLPETTEIVKYREPEALPLAKSLQYTELGKASTGDFSSTTEGESRRTLQYTDYMKAFTTTRLVDPRAVDPRKKYRNVDEYESARANMLSKPVTDEEQAWMDKKKQDAEDYERARLARLKTRDHRSQLHHDTVSRLMLGGR